MTVGEMELHLGTDGRVVVVVVVEVVVLVVEVVVGDVTVRMNLEEDSPLSEKSPSPFLSMQE